MPDRSWERNTRWKWKRCLWHEWNPRVSTLQWSRPETNVSTQTTCRFTVRSPLRGSVVPKVSPCCCSTHCLQSFISRRWLWYGLEKGAREARRVSRDVTPHRQRILDKTCDHSTHLDSRLHQAMRKETAWRTILSVVATRARHSLHCN